MRHSTSNSKSTRLSWSCYHQRKRLTCFHKRGNTCMRTFCGSRQNLPKFTKKNLLSHSLLGNVKCLISWLKNLLRYSSSSSFKNQTTFKTSLTASSARNTTWLCSRASQPSSSLSSQNQASGSSTPYKQERFRKTEELPTKTTKAENPRIIMKQFNIKSLSTEKMRGFSNNMKP